MALKNNILHIKIKSAWYIYCLTYYFARYEGYSEHQSSCTWYMMLKIDLKGEQFGGQHLDVNSTMPTCIMFKTQIHKENFEENS